MRRCSKCGFPLGVRPNTPDVNGVCGACINHEKKNDINFRGRQEWLTQFLKQHDGRCAVAVSGGKDSHSIVKKLKERHGAKDITLISLCDHFTTTRAGKHNLNNLIRYSGGKLFKIVPEKQEFIYYARRDFLEELHPLKWFEKKIYVDPCEKAKELDIPIIFYGENPDFEYGSSPVLSIEHPSSTETLRVIYMGAIHNYSITDSLSEARSIGFRDLDYYDEWHRQGSIDRYTQIDSYGYIMQLWTKFVKFGFQRVTDIACRYVREGKISRSTALLLIHMHDYKCDPEAKDDFCRSIGISDDEFSAAVDRRANREIVEKVNGEWRLKG